MSSDTSGGSAPAGPADQRGVSLPKGGGAIRGIGEKFSVNAANGTATFSIPLVTSAARDDFEPQLELSYDSGAGNGPFGLGWRLEVPAISRKTDKGLPRYADGEESDVFVMSHAEDLVPTLTVDGSGWSRETRHAVIGERSFRVESYRPRIETLNARVERWTAATGDVHWRVISAENVTHLYGTTSESRIADPAERRRVFSWLISESRDDRGNAILYRYKAEDAAGVDLSQAHERHRTAASRAAQRYLKSIRYCNRTPCRPDEDLAERTDWLFEIVLDYGEHGQHGPGCPPMVSDQAAGRPWTVRSDPFSSYRSGMDLRSYRLCAGVLLFHRFSELGCDDCLVRATHLSYRQTPVASFLTTVTEAGYVRRDDGSYVEETLPPIELRYGEASFHSEVRDADPETLDGLPGSREGAGHRWIDLDGDGVPGVLAEQTGSWLYKRNLSPATDDDGQTLRLGPARRVGVAPLAAMIQKSRWRWIDIAGDGRHDLVMLGGSLTGYHERTRDGEWAPFKPFPLAPNLSSDAREVRLIDLTGDGSADLLVTEDQVISWHRSIGDQGFDRSERVFQPLDEDLGPTLLLREIGQSLHLADMSGDGLADLVRVRNGDICYWPNLGYGHFGPKVTMDAAPWFDEPEQFDPHRLRLADIDGSGPVDIVYFAHDAACVYVNHSGNSWAAATTIPGFPALGPRDSIEVLDIMGTGTSSLVWSSGQLAESGRPLRYIDLLGGTKPHLLTAIVNNLGAETHIRYVPSTRFALRDDLAGQPWSTQLPFPVHVVERVTVLDRIAGSRFATRYVYHHGYFDAVEREFRGFGMVEQWDTDGDDRAKSDLTDASAGDGASWTPPVLTRSWFHTGAPPAAGTACGGYDMESWAEPVRRCAGDTAGSEPVLARDAGFPAGLSPEVGREAHRALKGHELRVEVYGQDESPQAGHPYSVVESTFAVRVLQPRAGNRHAVLLSHAREQVTLEYERVPDDPRVTHEITLEVDDFGNALRSVTVAYPRRHAHERLDPALPVEAREVLAADQSRLHVTSRQARFTSALVDVSRWPDAHRAPMPAEEITAELTGIAPTARRPGVTNLFSFEELDAAWDLACDGTHEVPSEEIPGPDIDGTPAPRSVVARRVLAHHRTLYRRDDLTGLLDLGDLEPRALPGESYDLALTEGHIERVFSGRVAATTLAEGGYVHPAGGSSWWVPSGRALYSPDESSDPAEELGYAQAHFFKVRRATDPFGAVHHTTYDIYDLLPTVAIDPLGNISAADNDYRVLSPFRITDPNGNRAEVAFDALGSVVGRAVMGPDGECIGDTLAGFISQLDEVTRRGHLNDPLERPAALLGQATSRILYDRSAYFRTRDQARPDAPAIYTLTRESHVSEATTPRHQHGFVYSDGFGREVQRKVLGQSAHDEKPIWITSGWTIFDGKGRPVRRYEPFFADLHTYEASRTSGVSTLLFYDPPGRLVGSLNPDNTWTKTRVGGWGTEAWDANDTVLVSHPRDDPDVGGHFSRNLGGSTEGFVSWYDRRIGGAWGSTPHERRAQEQAARKTAPHAATPTITHYDPRGRACMTVVDGGSGDLYATRTALDAGSRPVVVVDPLGRRTCEYCVREPGVGGVTYVSGYDLLGRELYRNTLDGGERRQLPDATSKPIRTWDARGHAFRTIYDLLHRSTHRYVSSDGAPETLFERSVYGEGQSGGNLRGRVFRVYDAAGVAGCERYDFKGNLVESSRRLAAAVDGVPDWSALASLEGADELDAAASPLLADTDRYVARTMYDALERPVQVIVPHRTDMRPSVLRVTYDAAARFDRVDVWIQCESAPEALLETASADYHAVTGISYDAAGRRTSVELGNGTLTTYERDPLTFRLIRLATIRRHGFRVEERTVQDLSYVHDPVGNVTSIRDSADMQNVVFFRNQRVEPSNQYTYDPLYRLTSATGREHLGQRGGVLDAPVFPSPRGHASAARLHPSDGNAMGRYKEHYVYDPVGNLTSVVHQVASGSWTVGYRHVEPSRIEAGQTGNRLSATSIDGTGSRLAMTHAYDEHGNTIRMPHVPNMAWDEHDRLRSCSRQVVNCDKRPETSFYAYDFKGERLREVITRQTDSEQEPRPRSERIRLGPIEIARTFGADGTVVAECETLHVHDGQDPILVIEWCTLGRACGLPPTLRYQYGGHLGSITLELDHRAVVISYEEYFPYGETSYRAVCARTLARKRHRFSGKPRDHESGFYYHGARYYAPWLGRWISCDPAQHRPPDRADGTRAVTPGTPRPRQSNAKSGGTRSPSPDTSPVPFPSTLDPAAESSYGAFRQNPLGYVDPDGREPEDKRLKEARGKKWQDRLKTAVIVIGHVLIPLMAGQKPMRMPELPSEKTVQEEKKKKKKAPGDGDPPKKSAREQLADSTVKVLELQLQLEQARIARMQLQLQLAQKQMEMAELEQRQILLRRQMDQSKILMVASAGLVLVGVTIMTGGADLLVAAPAAGVGGAVGTTTAASGAAASSAPAWLAPVLALF
jgi:RHS repeat-associated protein